jgi:hypothetical protein
MNPIKTNILRAGLLAALLSAFVIPSPSDARPQPNARPRISIELGSGPPALRIETYGRPPSRRHVWAPGYWDWSHRRHDWVWRAGGWQLPPRGRPYWAGPRYERRGDGWIVVRGRWSDDDRYDRRRDRHDHRDRDGRHHRDRDRYRY